MKDTLGIGIIGCGNISETYFKGVKYFSEYLRLVACADLNMDVARAKAEEHGCTAQTVEALLANPDVDMVINLTIATVHAKVSTQALNAGKHVHSEKPLATRLEDGQALIALAKEKSLSISCAPDTFLGAGAQTSRKIVDDGWIGRVTGGSAFMMQIGPEGWHPNPAIFYMDGSGPMMDMGPYYITTLVYLIGPVKRVCGITSKARETRLATCKERFGEVFPAEAPTHYTCVLEFQSGAVVNMTMSFDVHAHGHAPIELYGTRGNLRVPDPNTFEGPVELYTPSSKEWQTQGLSHPYRENSRTIGAADAAYAILNGSTSGGRCSGELALHVLEVLTAFEKASETGTYISIETQPERPEPLPMGLVEGRVV